MPLATPAPHHLPALARLIALAFGGTADDGLAWLKNIPPSDLRFIADADAPQAPVATLALVPMGQYFGGRPVPMTGIAGVAVAPEARGRGLARTLMNQCVRDLHDQGVPLSSLFPSTQALYRQSGYEQAGTTWHVRVPLARLAGLGKSRRVVALTEADQDRIAATYRAFAAPHAGMLDRGPYIWRRVRELRGSAYEGFGVLDDSDALAGYLFLRMHRPQNPGPSEIALQDFAFTSPAAGRALLAFLADFETTGSDLTFYAGPHHPALALLPQQRYTVTSKDTWMLRLTHAAAALEARGYPAPLSTRFTIDLADSLIPEQSGPLALEIEAGRARVQRRAAGPVLRCGERGLAAIYSGLYTPRQAAQIGWCDGDPEALDAAQLAFTAGSPWMADLF